MKKVNNYINSFILFCFTFSRKWRIIDLEFQIFNHQELHNLMKMKIDVCKLSPDSELIKLLNLKLKKFNPLAKELESQPPLTEEEIKLIQ